jgi:hypothetical protein
VWQRQTSFTSVVSDSYTADRWQYSKIGTMVHDITRDTDIPTDEGLYSIKIDCTTADASIAATDLTIFYQKIEGFNFNPFIGKSATLSFWVKATKTGTYCVSFRNSGADRSYVAEYTVNSANTWEQKEIPITFDYSGGTWNYTNGIGLYLSFCLACGSTFQTTADAWQSGNYLATSNQVNACDNTANNFFLSQIQLNEGSTYLSFQFRSFNRELLLCQRYYSKSYNYDVYPSAATLVGRAGELGITNLNNSDHTITASARYKVTMRAAPTITIYDMAGNSGKVTMIAGDNIAGTVAQIGHEAFDVSGTNGAASTTRYIACQYEADAEL